MNYNKLLEKTENEFNLKSFTKYTYKTYLYNIKKYIQFLNKILLNQDKVSTKK